MGRSGKKWQLIFTLGNGDYLMVIIDEFSRYPIVKAIKSTQATTVLSVLKETFDHFGYPKQVKSDNGPHFKVLSLSSS